jgi:hypothetical protein
MRRRKFWGIQIFISGEARFFRTVWGATLRLRLPALRQLEILFADSLDEAAQATAGWRGISIDLLLWCASDLPADAVTELKAAQAAWQARLMAVAWRFAGATARDALVNAGASVVRELSDDGALVAWRSSFDRLMTRLAWCAAGRKLAVVLCMGSIRACSMHWP